MRAKIEKIKKITNWNNKRIIETESMNIVIELKADNILEISNRDFDIIIDNHEKEVDINSDISYSIIKENNSAVIISFDMIKFRIYVQRILTKITLYDESFNFIYEDIFYLK